MLLVECYMLHPKMLHVGIVFGIVIDMVCPLFLFALFAWFFTQNVAHQEEEDGIDLNDTPETNSDDSLQLNTDGAAPNHGNAHVAHDNANGNVATLVDEIDEDIS